SGSRSPSACCRRGALSVLGGWREGSRRSGASISCVSAAVAEATAGVRSAWAARIPSRSTRATASPSSPRGAGGTAPPLLRSRWR
ncbi:unnamed protein product, partial [Ectocarpus sp. 8 AP-2014]